MLLVYAYCAGCTKQSPPSAAPSAIARAATTTSSGAVNLLSLQQGTIVRSWSAPAESAWGLAQGKGWTSGDDSTGPYAIVFELPSIASIQQLKFHASGDASTNAHSVHVDASTISSTSGFTNVGNYTLSDTDDDQVFSLSSPIEARWLKLTIDARGATTQLYDFEALGTFDQRPPSEPVSGAWILYEVSDGFPSIGVQKSDAGAFPGAPSAGQLSSYDKVVEIRQTAADVAAAICGPHSGTQIFRGAESGTTVTVRDEPDLMSPASINADGTLIVAGDTTDADGHSRNAWIAQRISGRISCASFDPDDNRPRGLGKGVLIVYDYGAGDYTPYEGTGLSGDDPIAHDYPGYRFVPVPATFFDPLALAGFDTVVLSQVCQAASMLSKQQIGALLDFIYEGHKLIIDDAQNCTKTDYGFLPYTFSSSNPGANGARGSDFVLVASNALGSNVRADAAHFVDMNAYVNDPNQQLGDANVVTTKDRHWCGHIYGTNVLNANGYVQMFAPFGQGMIIYNGFDYDDAGIPELTKINLLALELPPDAALTCSQYVADPISLADLGNGSDTSFSPGKATTIAAPLALVAEHGESGSAAISVTVPGNAPWPATVSSTQLPFNGGISRFSLNVAVPKNAKPGRYPFVVSATDGAGGMATTTVTIASSGAPGPPAQTRAAALPATPRIAKTLATARRVTVYGIYFDFASAALKRESTPVLKEIADALIANPTWTLTIEGHTDSIGTAAYNLDLSRRRADSVKTALVSRYHIKASRLATAGFGFSRPKASNDTPQGRALNRRVELVRT